MPAISSPRRCNTSGPRRSTVSPAPPTPRRTFVDDPPRAERSNYYDAGISHYFTPAWQVTVDGFYKAAKPLLDSGQFGNALILSPFNYKDGKQYGAEIGSTFKNGGLSIFGNFSWVNAEGRNINSNQYLIGNDELAFIKTHFIPLDHDGMFTASAGAFLQLEGQPCLSR